MGSQNKSMLTKLGWKGIIKNNQLASKDACYAYAIGDGKDVCCCWIPSILGFEKPVTNP